ncbi:uncharacterized protein LOC127738527 [Mytilus californianus]|uniref:uncharacterized protein LOC127738527 n=1 Tax=Mytilus californianus TaxID=6549 RepID=UPI002246B0EA|nr:uncharacterized protein LOC127738527 [Mytilus californianus]
MGDQIDEEKDSFLERGKYTGTSSSTESERKNCMHDTDHKEEHTSSLKSKTTQSPFKEINPEISGSGIEKSEVKTVQWLQGNIETRYIANQGFQHKFITDSSNKASSTLKLRNSDQLLDINDEDVTLMSHTEVLGLLEKIPLNENATLIYMRPSSNSVTDVKFSLYKFEGTFVVRLHNHSSNSVEPDSTKIWKRMVVLNKQLTHKFMQAFGKQSDRIVFKQLESEVPNKGPCKFLNSRFLEERKLVEQFYRRRYSTISQNGENKYLHVTDDGDLTLVPKSGKLTNFEFKLIPARFNAFYVLNEISTDRFMKLEGNEGKFADVNYKPDVDRIGDDFRFELQNCNCKRSHKSCVII